MTPDELKAALAELGWKGADFARRAGLNKDTPGRWLSGATPIPLWVGSYLGTVLDVARLHAKYAQPLKKQEPD